MRNAELKYVDERLYQWACWSRQHGIYLSYPRQNIIDKMRKEGIETTALRKEKNGVKPIYMPTDIEEVEVALITLKNPDYWDVIKFKYLYRHLDNDCAIELSKKWNRSLTVSMFRKMLERALYWLDGRLQKNLFLN